MDQDNLFYVRNKHTARCGTPPQIDGNTLQRYHSYFENGYGEQLIFLYDRQTDKGILYHGDMGWERPCPVEEGGRCPSVVLDEGETLWLRACWLAATAGKRARQMAAPASPDES